MVYLNELHEGDTYSEIYYCKDKKVGTSKNGKTYYALTLQDQSGSADGKIWDLTNAIEHFETGDFIKVDFRVTLFNEKIQLNINRAKRAAEGEYDISDFMPTSQYNIDDMYGTLMKKIDSIEDPHLHELLTKFFVDDKEVVSGFRSRSAAKGFHHAFVGGLLQHTICVASISDYLAKLYPVINRDLLVTAAICHDIGKVKELSDFPQNDYTDAGNLLGHIVMGAMMVKEKADSIEGFPQGLKDELVHCILSHHGKLEFGSPEKPKIIEAVALNFADDTDAKLEAFTEALKENSTEEQWMPYSKMFDTVIRRTGDK